MTPPESVLTDEGVVQRALHWTATIVVALNLALSIGRATALPTAYVPGFAVLVLASIGAFCAWSLVCCLRRRSAVRPLRAIVVIACTALLLHPWTAGPGAVPYPPLFHVLGAAMCISVVFGVPTAAILIPVFATVVAAQRVSQIGVVEAVGESCLLALSGAIATASVDVLVRAGRKVAGAVEATRTLELTSALKARSAFEHVWWNAFVHDKVIGALRTAVRAPGVEVRPQARELALEALSALRGEPFGGLSDPVEEWRTHASRLGLTLTTHVNGQMTAADVHSTLVDAAKEALTNVARHSGQDKATVYGSMSDQQATIVISDHGVGFDAATVDRGAGLRSSVVDRMRNVGGSATISSSPGLGCHVTLSWSELAPAADDSPARWQLTIFAPLMVLGGLSLLLNVMMGSAQWGSSRYPVLAILGIAAITAITATAAITQPVRRRWIHLALGGAVVAALLTANTPDGASLDWRYWYLGALTASMGPIAYRFEPWAGLASATSFTGAVVLTDALYGRSPWSCLGGPVPVLIATAIAGHLLRTSLAQTWRRVAESTAQGAELRLSIAVEQERMRVATSRTAALAVDVSPALELIASAGSLSPAQLRELVLLENSTRDDLNAPMIVDADLAHMVYDGRSRGVRVEVIRQDQPSRPDAAVEGTAFRSLLGQVLIHAQARTRVRVVCGAPDGVIVGTISVVGDDLQLVSEQLRAAVERLPPPQRPHVSGDEDYMLLDFGPPPPAIPQEQP